MTSAQAYQLFLLKLNRNDTNGDIHISRAEFVRLFNEQQRTWTSTKIGKKLNSDEINDLNELLVPFTKLAKGQTEPTHVDFALPEDFFTIGAFYVIGNKDKCKRVLEPEWLNIKDVTAHLLDQYSKPSFEYERTFVTLASNKLQVYIDGFDIFETHIAYYKFPADIDIEGYIDEAGKASKTIDPVLSDGYVEQTINRVVLQVAVNYSGDSSIEGRQHIITTEE